MREGHNGLTVIMNDFWQVNMVTVPADYVANTITSYQEIVAKGSSISKTSGLVNCPVVPKGSTAAKRYSSGDPGLRQGWYQDSVVYYFNFAERHCLSTPAVRFRLLPSM